MAEYISRKDVIKQIKIADFICDNDIFGGELLLFADDVIRRINSIPSKSVRPNIKNKWIELDDCMTICPECNGLGCGSNFCPNCGADMRGEDDG